MKLTTEQIKQIEDSAYVVVFDKEPQEGDTFSVGTVVFTATNKEQRIKVL